MDKLYAIKIKQEDGSYGAAIPIHALATNIDWNNVLTLVDILGQVDTSMSIQDQINNLKNTKANQNAINALEIKIDNAINGVVQAIQQTSYDSLEERLNSGFLTVNVEIAKIQENIQEMNTPQNITIAIADWVSSGSLFTAQKICNKATTDSYNTLTFIPQNPDPATKAGLQILQKNLSYLFSRPTIGNKIVTFTAVTKPTIPLTFSVVGGIT